MPTKVKGRAMNISIDNIGPIVRNAADNLCNGPTAIRRALDREDNVSIQLLYTNLYLESQHRAGQRFQVDLAHKKQFTCLLVHLEKASFVAYEEAD